MAKKVYGLKSILMGFPLADGSMATTLLEVFGETVIGSATLSMDAPSKSPVKTEEKRNAIYFIQGDDPDFMLKASTYNISASTMKRLFGGTLNGIGGVQTTGTVVGGTVYTNGTYTGVELTGGTGIGATATIVVAAAVVTTVTITAKGAGYTVADSLTAPAASIGGTGSGFSVPVATLYTGLENWTAPIGGVRPDFYQSVVAETATGIKFKFVKMDLSAGLAIAYDKTKLGQIDWTGLLMEPDKVNTAAWGIDWPA